MNWVRISHPDLDQEATVAASAVAVLGKSGWQVSGAPDSEPPTRSSTKAEWVEYAASHGIPREQAEQHTKDELIDQFTEPEPEE